MISVRVFTVYLPSLLETDIVRHALYQVPVIAMIFFATTTVVMEPLFFHIFAREIC